VGSAIAKPSELLFLAQFSLTGAMFLAAFVYARQWRRQSEADDELKPDVEEQIDGTSNQHSG
jgi:hypothetical protein